MQGFGFKWSAQPLDRVAIALMVVLSVVIGLLVLSGDHTSPRVRSFTWQDKQVGAEDSAFILTFSRPMDHASVEQNLRIVPPLEGKVSWAGRRMAYTLDTPAPYGTAFELELRNAHDRFSDADDKRPIQPFTGRFRTRDRAFVYLGTEGDENGRIVLENLTRQEHRVLTPPNLVVMDYKPYPAGDRILFSASEKTAQPQGLLNQKLYVVTTGIQPLSPADSPIVSSASAGASNQPVADAEPRPAGEVTEVLDSQDYQNLKFDLSPNGQTIVVQRVNRKDPADAGLWIIRQGQPAAPLKTEPGGDFLIAPDSNSLAMSQGQGLAILPLESEAEPLDFLAKFGVILDFSNDGTAAATVQFDVTPDREPTRSLFLVTNQGQETKLLSTDGSILSAQFAPTKQVLYALVTARIPNEQVFLEQPYLIAINLQDKTRTDLLKLPIQRDIQMDLAPDGLGILFDQITAIPADESNANAARTSDGSAIAASRLWFLPAVLDPDGQPLQAQPSELALPGLRPRWLP
ncbi:MAG TPA: Ig-like domain-containing protein [Chroococcidiopsis sp.]